MSVGDSLNSSTAFSRQQWRERIETPVMRPLMTSWPAFSRQQWRERIETSPRPLLISNSSFSRQQWRERIETIFDRVSRQSPAFSPVSNGGSGLKRRVDDFHAGRRMSPLSPVSNGGSGLKLTNSDGITTERALFSRQQWRERIETRSRIRLGTGRLSFSRQQWRERIETVVIGTAMQWLILSPVSNGGSGLKQRHTSHRNRGRALSRQQWRSGLSFAWRADNRLRAAFLPSAMAGAD